MAVDYAEIAQNIKLCRTRRRLKQRELAEMVHVSEHHISHIECGRTTPSLGLLIQLAESLSVSIYTLLGGNAHEKSVADMEVVALFQDATHAQRELCLTVCRDILDYKIQF